MIPANNSTDGRALRIRYEYADPASLLGEDDVLAVIGFGTGAAAMPVQAGALRVGLEPLTGTPAPFEVWRGRPGVERGIRDGIQWSHDGALAWGALEVDEAEEGGIAHSAMAAYRRLLAWLAGSGYPALLRVWNYLDAITEGEGDEERYRQFCLGRAEGLKGRLSEFPAATAIGRLDGARTLQVYWLAAAHGGTGIENPRQISAFRYPRRYGPRPPSFARATLPQDPSLPLLLSGTASIVGHSSRHDGDLDAQLIESLHNIAAVLDAARAQRAALPATLGAGSLLKVYLRDHAHASRAIELLDTRLPACVPRLLLHAGICRRELLVEIDGVHR